MRQEEAYIQPYCPEHESYLFAITFAYFGQGLLSYHGPVVVFWSSLCFSPAMVGEIIQDAPVRPRREYFISKGWLVLFFVTNFSQAAQPVLTDSFVSSVSFNPWELSRGLDHCSEKLISITEINLEKFCRVQEMWPWICLSIMYQNFSLLCVCSTNGLSTCNLSHWCRNAIEMVWDQSPG